MKTKNTPKNIYSFFIGLVFAVSLLFAGIAGAHLWELGLDYAWQTETCIYRPDKYELPEDACKYDGRQAARETAEAIPLLVVLGFTAFLSYRKLKAQI